MFLIALKHIKTLTEAPERLEFLILRPCDFGIKGIKNINPPRGLCLMFLNQLTTLKTQAFQGD